MSLYEQIRADYKNAMREKLQVKKEALMFVIWLFKYRMIEKKSDEISDDDVISILKKEIKTRIDAMENYQKVWNQEEVDIQKQNVDILSKYVPQMLSEEQTKQIIDQKQKELWFGLPAQRWQLIWAIMKSHRSVIDPQVLNNLL